MISHDIGAIALGIFMFTAPDAWARGRMHGDVMVVAELIVTNAVMMGLVAGVLIAMIIGEQIVVEPIVLESEPTVQ